MNIPFLTAYIGSSCEDGNQNEYSSIVKKISIKDGDNPFVVYLIFDINDNDIYFDVKEPYTEESCYKYYYFKNNSAAAAQFYMTRDIKSLNYLLGSSFSDLYGCLNKYDMGKCELAELLKLLEKRNLIKIENKKGYGSVNLNKIKGYEDKDIVLEQKNLFIDKKKISFDNFVREFIDNNNKKNKFAMIVPIIVKDKNEIIISQHKDYLKLVKIALNLGDCDSSKKNSKSKICYICGKNEANVNSEYSGKFTRVNINKVFTITTKNYSQINKNFNHDDNYSFCQSCYKKLMSGANIINQKFVGKLAGESAFILPEGIDNNFDYEKIYTLKNKVDLLFNGTEAEDFIKTTDDSSVFDDVKFYSVNFIVYRTDGNSIDVIETIEDVPTLRIEKIIQSLGDNSLRYGEKTNIMHISDVYRIIPVREDKKHNQINIGRVLDLYKSILCGEIIDSENIYSYANEAMEKGCKQLDKKLMDNYRNMKLQYYKRIDSKDYFIQNITMKYIAFFKSLQELKLLNREVFNGEERDEMGTINTMSDDVNKSINEIEEFLSSRKFSNEAKALFYLGILINKVAYEQWKRGHKTKPILKKIQFQGMKCPEIYRLYNDVVERLNQYNALDIFNEAYMNRFHLYSGVLDLDKKNWALSDQANVFYIMAGYSYMVGNIKKQNKELKDNESEGK
ncbi:TM1802 family CRISPR-associated protein [Clostridium sp. WLY-B-L2]|uniref:TM1802 family CRISPR-associated protein n=1 Tax=Clostridium aromativorans TaxID=2836848 RepID=A0ABS8N542_9CLOT|nr:TM1802 family CRISPR-associated protein [Clostridium aromativorans]MCC9294936.1 TM1802 family CRISPR-associated protein [Clostridium aromativorans]